jgi:sugar phosphate isomerase/epimerase
MKKKVYIGFVIFVLTIMVGLATEPQAYGTKPGDGEEEKPAIGSQYEGVRIKKFPFAVQCWTFRKFTFFEALQKIKDLGIKYVQPYPGQPLDKNNPKLKFDHNISDEQIDLIKEKLKETGLSLVSYGVVNFENSEVEMSKMFEFAKKMGIRTIVTEPSYDDFSLIDKMVKKHGINVAIHNHPTPSKYARPETVIYRVDGLDPRIGACADTGHWMRSGVKPLEALRALKGRIQDVHLKDLNAFGTMDAYDVPFGEGKANVHDILAELTLQDYAGYISIEHEKKEDIDNPSPAVKKGVEYINSITYYQDHEQILKRSYWGYSKHGWNHYGPGYFELDEKTGVLKGQGGMGLLWYAVKKHKDFILELDYKCEDEFTNSGVFLRVPNIPVNDDYIYHSFEIQINPAGEGIHRTGAAYDAEAPMKDAFNPPGEWNHFKISFLGNRIKVELNDVLVLDWEAEPRGKVRDFASEGYIGLQNHDSQSPVYFKNIYVKEISWPTPPTLTFKE